jgi:hypothetical protein
MKPTNEEKKIAEQVAKEFNVPYNVLEALIKFESNWNPQAKNPYSYSSARGLLQWVDITAQSMGYKNALDLVTQHPTTASQLRGPVREYFKKYAPYANENEFIGAVFYPAYRRDMSRVLPDSVQKVNPGIRTMGDYIAGVRSRMGLGPSPLLILAVAAVAVGVVSSRS